MAYDVEVEWMDGKTKAYPKVVTNEDDGLLTVKSGPRGTAPAQVLAIIPLRNVREVRFP